MRKGLTNVSLVLGTVLLAAGTAALAHRNGAQPGFNGGLGAGGWTCTACHLFNQGTGRVELLGGPRRYRSGERYDLTVRVTAPQEDGAGFQLSAERNDFFCVGGSRDGLPCTRQLDCPGGGDCTPHVGTMSISDAVNTDFSSGSADYVTHTNNGVDDSIADWITNGGSYDYHVRWIAPTADAGPVTFFSAANAVDLLTPFAGVRFYMSHLTAHFAQPADADGDGDVDLRDFATYQTCFSDGAAAADGGCEFNDADGDGTVSLDDLPDFHAAMEGPVSTFPAGYLSADPVRGGQLYDRWWTVARVPAPTGKHPLYPPAGVQSGSSTFRCKECHGWDYKGLDGQYGTGSHFTGIVGVQHTALSPQQVFDLLKADPAETPVGHDMDAYGMSDADLWDVVKMTLEGVVDTDDVIPRTCTGGGSDGAVCISDGDCPSGVCDITPVFAGDADLLGPIWYDNICASCHGYDGTAINFGSVAYPVYVGTVAYENPWEFVHKVRFGHPAAAMPASELLRWPLQRVADVGAYAATLPR